MTIPTTTELLEELAQLTKAAKAIEGPIDTKYAQFVDRKTSWVPAHYQSNQMADDPVGIRSTLQRCLALAIQLEVPVGLFTLDASNREFTQSQRFALLDNSSDEIRHYEALTNWVASSDPLPVKLVNEAVSFRQALVDLDEHPVVTAGTIELGCFFPVLAIFRKFGPASLKLLSADISRDESSHVLTNWTIIDDQAIPATSKHLNRMRLEIINWLTQDLKSRKYGPSFWLNQSNSLMETRKAQGLEFTRAATYTAFFEVDNRSLAAY